MSSDPPPPDPPAFDPTALMQDWMTLWQSEAAGMSLDREVHENWARLAEFWTQPSMQAAMQAAAQGAAGDAARGARADDAPRGARADHTARGARADDAPRPAPAGDAPDAHREIAALRGELAELRQRLDRLEAAPPRKQRARRTP